MTPANSYDRNPDAGDCAKRVNLSPRQRQMLTLLKAGKTNKQIAAELDIGIGTVKQHLVTLFRKLGVTNRAMAISKGLTMDGVNIDGPTPLEPGEGVMESMLERRPAAVLSLESQAEGAAPGEAAYRDIYKIYAEVAFDFGAVFLSHRGGRCDMVFGVRRVRRHDVLRAIRAAVAVSEDIDALPGTRPALRAALAFGFIFASTDGEGEWTGEAIGGSVIPAARALLADAAPGCVVLHDSARGVMRALGVRASGDLPDQVPLNRNFRWNRQPVTDVGTLHGRVVEMETLRGHMKRLKRESLNAAFVEGESGMGKSALVVALAALAEREGLATETWLCSIPDSQPGSPSLDRLENADDGRVLTVADFLHHMTGLDANAPRLVVIEDGHLLRTEMFALLSASFNHFAGTHVMSVMTYRGRAPLSPVVAKAVEVVYLAHIPEEKQAAFIDELLGPGHEAAAWVRRLAGGVPAFIVSLANYVLSGEERGRHGPGEVPPASLFAQIAERIEAHGVDRRLLYMVARAGPDTTIPDLRARWRDGPGAFDAALDRAVQSGVLTLTPAKGRKPGRAEIGHPLVRWVMAAAFQPQDTSFG